jgi:copper transport protein
VLVIACGWVAFRPDRVIDPVTQLASARSACPRRMTIGLSRTNMDLAAIAVPLSIIHALAMSVWIGGVALLARVVLAGPGEEDLVHAVRGFGRLSNVAIGATIATGIVQMMLLDSDDLFGSSHGRVDAAQDRGQSQRWSSSRCPLGSSSTSVSLAPTR